LAGSLRAGCPGVRKRRDEGKNRGDHRAGADTVRVHIIKVTGRDNRELKLAQIQMKITTSAQTQNDLFERARTSPTPRKTPTLSNPPRRRASKHSKRRSRKGRRDPRGRYNEALIRWAFKQSTGAVSDVFTFPSGYLVPRWSMQRTRGQAFRGGPGIHATERAPEDQNGQGRGIAPDTVKNSVPRTACGN